MKPTATGIKRILKAFTYSYDGFWAAFESEEAFRQDMIIFIIGTLALFFIPVSLIAKAIMFFALILILLMELVNTAIEFTIDRIGDEFHILSKKAKDVGSLLVLIAFINAGVVWIACLLA